MRILRRLPYMVLTALVLLVLTLNILSMTHLPFFGYRIYRIGSGSMEPELKTNSLIIINKEKEYKVNDIVTYTDVNGDHITHRIIEINGDEYITRGDANNVEDDPIGKNMIEGKVVLNFLKSGFANYLILSPVTWFLSFGLGLFIILGIAHIRIEEKDDGSF